MNILTQYKRHLTPLLTSAIYYTAQVFILSNGGVVSRSEVCLVILLLSTAMGFSLTVPQLPSPLQ